MRQVILGRERDIAGIREFRILCANDGTALMRYSWPGPGTARYGIYVFDHLRLLVIELSEFAPRRNFRSGWLAYRDTPYLSRARTRQCPLQLERIRDALGDVVEGLDKHPDEDPAVGAIEKDTVADSWTEQKSVNGARSRRRRATPDRRDPLVGNVTVTTPASRDDALCVLLKPTKSLRWNQFDRASDHWLNLYSADEGKIF